MLAEIRCEELINVSAKGFVVNDDPYEIVGCDRTIMKAGRVNDATQSAAVGYEDVSLVNCQRIEVFTLRSIGTVVVEILDVLTVHLGHCRPGEVPEYPR